MHTERKFTLDDYKELLTTQQNLKRDSEKSISEVRKNGHYWGWDDNQINEYVSALEPHLEKNAALISLCVQKIYELENEKRD